MLRKHLQDAAIGLVVTILLFAVCELSLFLLGLGTPSLATNLSRGFDATAAYLVPDPQVPGGFVTQFSDGKFPEKTVPPKSDRFRVVLVGGSNTASFRANWLADSFERTGTDAFEVVNLGREGYGSERVAIVVDQALDLIEPDLIVIYSGHNEFIERGFRMDLDDQWETEWGRELGDVARRSRIVNWMTDVLAPEPISSGARPERQKEEYAKFSDITYDETKLYLDAYAANLASMCERADEAGCDVLISTVIYNRFAAPFISTLPAGTPADDAAAFGELRAEIEALLPAFLDPLLPTEGWEHIFQSDWIRGAGKPGAGDDLPGRRTCFGPLAERAPELPEPKRKVRRFYKTLERMWNQEISAEERAGLERVRDLLERALERQPDHPESLFESAVVLSFLGENEPLAAQRFEDAGRYDRAPRRGSSATNDIVRDVAKSLDVPLFDADAIFAERMPNRLVGFEWMIDECHLSVGARYVLMDDLAARVVSDWP